MSGLKRKLRKRHQSVLTFSRQKISEKIWYKTGKYPTITVKMGSFHLQQLRAKAIKMTAWHVLMLNDYFKWPISTCYVMS